MKDTGPQVPLHLLPAPDHNVHKVLIFILQEVKQINFFVSYKVLSLYPKPRQMRYKFPQVLCFQDWVELYKMPDMGDKGFVYKEPFKYDETDEMKDARKEIQATLEKHQQAILEVEEKMVKYGQLDTLKDPPIYLAMIRDTRNKEAETLTLTAKTFWPLMNGKRKEIRIYIGKESEYPDYKKDFVAKIAKQKMKEHLLERYKNGELK